MRFTTRNEDLWAIIATNVALKKPTRFKLKRNKELTCQQVEKLFSKRGYCRCYRTEYNYIDHTYTYQVDAL